MAGVTLLFGPMMIGVMLNMILYGAMFTQMVAYYQRYTQDSPWIRYLMLYLLVVETAGIIVECGIIYDPLIFQQRCGDYNLSEAGFYPESVLPPSWFPKHLTSRISVVTQSLILPGIIALLSLGSFGAGITVSILVSLNPEFHKFGNFKAVITLWLVLSAVCDIVIAVGMTHALYTRKTGFGVVDGQINRIIRLTVETGALTAITALVDLMLFLVFPNTTINFIVDFPLSNLYTFSMLAMLNSRERNKTVDAEHFQMAPQSLAPHSILSLRLSSYHSSKIAQHPN
ncbi:hypothetical protein DFH08DRAFT_984880 [Mycena albidolilacea]|uniref:DUF6534 domain-containing protein n=1 Tax=Mycena albidolilacea TaxID=1033008 RepID=A0AAD7ABM4_9AGAR|nr:hypothetical protein DFH08DRAFT_984880 [Mycena albidolilacea]